MEAEDKYKIKLQQIEKESRELTEPLKNINEEILLLLVQTRDHDKVRSHFALIQGQKTEGRDQHPARAVRAAAAQAGVRVRGQAAAVQLPQARQGLPLQQVQPADPEDPAEDRPQGNSLNQEPHHGEADPGHLREHRDQGPRAQPGAQVAQHRPRAARYFLNAVGITRTLEEVEELKNQQISELESKLLQIRKAHSHMVKAYEGKLSEYVIPVEELGFDPLVPNNVD